METSVTMANSDRIPLHIGILNDDESSEVTTRFYVERGDLRWIFSSSLPIAEQLYVGLYAADCVCQTDDEEIVPLKSTTELLTTLYRVKRQNRKDFDEEFSSGSRYVEN